MQHPQGEVREVINCPGPKVLTAMLFSKVHYLLVGNSTGGFFIGWLLPVSCQGKTLPKFPSRLLDVTDNNELTVVLPSQNSSDSLALSGLCYMALFLAS